MVNIDTPKPAPDRPGSAATPVTEAPGLPPASLPAEREAERRYFRCDRLAATLSRAQCRTNRAKLSYRDGFVLPDGPPPDVQPWQCSSCGLALRLDRGLLPLFTAREVLAGRARAAGGPAYGEELATPFTWPHSGGLPPAA